MVDNNKTLVRGLFAAWNAHDIDGVAACIGDTCNGGGAEGIRRELAAFLAAFPDMSVTIEDILAEGEKVATRTTFSATHQGAFAGIAPTGKPVTMKAHHIFRCEGGRVVQRHGQMDRLELVTQLGARVVPPTSDSGD